MIARFASSKLSELIIDFPAIGIVGPRQVGKTTLAKQIGSLIDHEVIYLDLELPSDNIKLQDPETFLKSQEDKSIIIDEIQLKPDLFPVLRALIDQNRRPGRFIILGSAAPSIIRDASESLAGRIYYMELTPFNLLEVEGNYPQDLHWFRGGFPEAFLAPNEQSLKNRLDAFIKTYTEKDFPFFGIGGTPQVIQRFWSMLAFNQGNIWNASSFGRALGGITHHTIAGYLDILEGAFFINRLPSFFSNGTKRLVKSPKVYIRDSGILHRLAGIADFDSLRGNVLIGTSWEGYVIEQIKQLLALTDVQLYFYRTHAGAECDLVFVRSGEALATAEIKYSNSPALSKGYTESLKDIGCEKNYVITPSSDEFLMKKNIIVCSLKTFLKNYLPAI